MVNKATCSALQFIDLHAPLKREVGDLKQELQGGLQTGQNTVSRYKTAESEE
jgi:hypothetical protein